MAPVVVIALAAKHVIDARRQPTSELRGERSPMAEASG
jgi:hypothetical protein